MPSITTFLTMRSYSFHSFSSKTALVLVHWGLVSLSWLSLIIVEWSNESNIGSAGHSSKFYLICKMIKLPILDSFYKIILIITPSTPDSRYSRGLAKFIIKFSVLMAFVIFFVLLGDIGFPYFQNLLKVGILFQIFRHEVPMLRSHSCLSTSWLFFFPLGPCWR